MWAYQHSCDLLNSKYQHVEQSLCLHTISRNKVKSFEGILLTLKMVFIDVFKVPLTFFYT